MMLSWICHRNLFHIGSEYDHAVEDIMDNLIKHTSESPVLDYYIEDTHLAETYDGQDITLYGHGVCTSTLPQQDCHDCIEYANSKMFKECTHGEGAQIQLMDCQLR
ncbi:hypothetical protein MLD38_020437 [Melastoma candidum]|uniref:Uncharacterized protein n=1 Tax=Melastoma candidum TaxID=119954 RepID=A0ACB9QE54_9MYRT|nr:hypothetical protein MLD38_020437 [Melastoma candidum]